MTSSSAGMRRRPNDPHRRERIARAAMAVVASQGIEGLTHRAVAAEADVPLGSTTYHFATLDDLLEVALTRAAEDNIVRMREWEAALAPGVDVAAAITDLILDSLRQRATVVEYELLIAALHRPRLRPAAATCDDALAEVFGARTDPLTGRVLAGLYCGALMHAAVAATPPTRDAVLALFRHAVDRP